LHKHKPRDIDACLVAYVVVYSRSFRREQTMRIDDAGGSDDVRRVETMRVVLFSRLVFYIVLRSACTGLILCGLMAKKIQRGFV